MFKYKKQYNGTITKFEIVRETEHTVWFNEPYKKGRDQTVYYRVTQERKNTSGESWSNTYEEAKQSIIKNIQRTVDNLEYRLNEAKKELTKAQNLKEDDV